MIRVTLKPVSARRILDPNFPDAVEHLFTLNVLDLPKLPLGSNPRDQNTNRQVYRDVAGSLRNEEGAINSFFGKNLGVYACARAVEKVDRAKGEPDEFTIHFGEGESVLDGLDGILNGGHTAQIIWDNQPELRQRREEGDEIEQFVRLYVRQGYPRPLLAEMAGTLNTAVQVQDFSLAEHQDKFKWIHDSLAGKSYADAIAFKENVNADYYVTDVLSMMALFDTTRFPNNGGSHPTGAYAAKSQVLKRYLEDPGPFERLEPILNDILVLHDTIAMEGTEKYNRYFRNDPVRKKGRAGGLEWVDKKERGEYTFPFIGTAGEYRLNRAAIYPALAAFRWMVEEEGPRASWKGGFDAVREVWEEAGPEMMKMTQDTSLENARKTLAIGKSATHYNALHSAVAKHQLMSRA
jgi:AIPR protein